MKSLTWWMSSVKITANLSAEDRELQDSSTGQQPRRLLMYWFVGLWNADNLSHSLVFFGYLLFHQPQVPHNKTTLVYCWANFQSMPFVQGVMGQHKHIKATNWHFTSQLGFPYLLHCVYLRMSLENISWEKKISAIATECIQRCFHAVPTYKI